MLEIIIVPTLSDNYTYLLYDREANVTSCVDPGESVSVIEALKGHQMTLDEILITHHHSDHTAGIRGLKKYYNCRVIGPLKEAKMIPEVDEGLKEGDSHAIGLSTSHIILETAVRDGKLMQDLELESLCNGVGHSQMVKDHPIANDSGSRDCVKLPSPTAVSRIMEIPGHTLGHIAYYFEKDKALFCGDTLFSLGCGRLFEGTAEQMYHSLQRIKKLPKDTRIYCGHEYTLNNGAFALNVDPDNKDLQKMVESAKQMRLRGNPTIPSTIADEMAANPFLLANSVEEFALLRRKKDMF